MRVVHCLNILNSVRDIPGDVVECGAFKGRTTFALAEFMEQNMRGRKCYACDTFTGLPYDDVGSHDRRCMAGECNGGNEFKNVLSAKSVRNIVTVEGLIEDTLEKHLSDQKFCFVWLDMDLYVPTSYAVKFFTDRINKGGVLGFHDYQFVRCPGVTKVVDEELDRDKFSPILQANDCIFFKKR